MAYIIQLGDPKPNRGDQQLSEQVEMIVADDILPSVHEFEVNEFLVSLRDDPEHVVAIRSVDLQLTSVSQIGNIRGITTIHYLLIGDASPPYIP
jgi:hypothetical protein